MEFAVLIADTNAYAIAELIGVSVAILVSISGFVYWVVKRSIQIATKEYVDDTISDELSPIEEKVEKAYASAASNEQDLQHLKDLLEGGNSTFEKGVIEYLDENIERTKNVKGDVEQIREKVQIMKEKHSSDGESPD